MTQLFDTKTAYLHLLLCAALVVAPLVTELSLWVLLLFAAMASWRYLIEHHAWHHPGRFLRLVLALLFVFLVLQQHGTVMGRDAGLSLLILLLGLKFLELRKRRDYVLSVLLLYLLIMGNFLFSQSLPIALYMSLVLLLCTATLIHLNHQHSSSAGYRLRLSAAMLAKALPLMLVMYLLFPRIQGGFWGGLGGDGTGISGMSDTMRPGSVNELVQSQAVAFRAKFNGIAPQRSQLYWRSLVLWHTDGQLWNQGAAMNLPLGKVRSLEAAVEYQITQEPNYKRWVYALDMPLAPSADIRLKPGQVLLHKRIIRKRVRYKLLSATRYLANSASTLELQMGLQLPQSKATQARAMAQQWREQLREPDKIIQAALLFFRQQDFYYTLNPPLLGEEPVDEFLFQSRRGFCEHYAAAFTTLMRAAGIPSRVVLGYQGGEYNTQGDYFIVRQSDAHAWSEVWLAQRGWVRIDPTAAVAPERIEYGFDAMRRLRAQGLDARAMGSGGLLRALERSWLSATGYRIRQSWDAVNLAWFHWVSDFTPERQTELLDALGLHAPNWLGKALILLAGVALLFVFTAAFTLRLTQRRDPVQRQYLRFCAKLAKAGLPRAAHEGPLDYCQRVSRLSIDPQLEAGIVAITALYLQLRYGSAWKKPDFRRLSQVVNKFKPASAARA